MFDIIPQFHIVILTYWQYIYRVFWFFINKFCVKWLKIHSNLCEIVFKPRSTEKSFLTTKSSFCFFLNIMKGIKNWISWWFAEKSFLSYEYYSYIMNLYHKVLRWPIRWRKFDFILRFLTVDSTGAGSFPFVDFFKNFAHA